MSAEPILVPAALGRAALYLRVSTAVRPSMISRSLTNGGRLNPTAKQSRSKSSRSSWSPGRRPPTIVGPSFRG